jgi:hypothetical protein
MLNSDAIGDCYYIGLIGDCYYIGLVNQCAMRHMVTIASKVLRCKRLKHIVGPQVSVVDHQGLSIILFAILDRELSKHLGDHQGVQDTTKHDR